MESMILMPYKNAWFPGKLKKKTGNIDVRFLDDIMIDHIFDQVHSKLF